MITSLNQLDLNGTYSYTDYLLWRFQEKVELIKGKIYKMSPAPSRAHQEVSFQLTGLFWQYFQHKDCKVFPAPFDVRLPKKSAKEGEPTYTVVQPDLCVICDLTKLDDRGCVGAPDLIIEILSPGNSRREMKEKYEVYEESGVKEYWIVHPTEKSVQIFLLDEAKEKFYGIQPFVADDVMNAQIFPDLALDLAEVFAE